MSNPYYPQKSRRRAFAALAITTLLAFYAQPLFAVTQQLVGKWACAGQGAFGDNPGTLFTINEALQLATDATGKVSSGTLIYSAGETCDFTVAAGSTYNVNASNGTGVIDLNLTVPESDEDGDFDCSSIFGASPTVEADIVVVNGAQQFLFTSADDYVTSKAEEDAGDFVPISGQCVKQ
jgi:hypothetical protein